LHESTIYRRREKLRKIADGSELGGVYGAAIARIKAQDGDKSRLGMAALLWISHAERPLRANELCHALAVDLGPTDFNIDNVPSVSTLVNCCQGLIAIDKEASTVRLIHFTLQEYLSGHPDIFSRPHSAMAEICLTYLGSKQVKALSTRLSPGTWTMPFLAYCSVYWGVHAKRELSDSARSLALELLRGDCDQISTQFLLARVDDLARGKSDAFFPFSGLHCAAFFGITEVVTTLIGMGCHDINGGDFSGRTPLAWAAHNGHAGMVKTLLEWEEVNPDKADNDGRTPLSFTATGGHEGVTKILLGRGEVNPDKPDSSNWTPLMHAAWSGHEGVVEVLLAREEANPDKPNNYGWTPLMHAAWKGHEGVVKILLGREEVNPDKPNNYGWTPLTFAAWSGHEGVVKILLGREEVNPDKPDNYGWTPLSHAAGLGHEGVVKILLAREEVNPDKPDINGSTPLSYAARSGHEEVAKILLGREEVNPNKRNDDWQTPLSLATAHGHERVAALLISRQAVIPSTIQATAPGK